MTTRQRGHVYLAASATAAVSLVRVYFVPRALFGDIMRPPFIFACQLWSRLYSTPLLGQCFTTAEREWTHCCV